MLLAQPGQYLWITFAQGIEIVPEGGDDNDVGIFQTTVYRDLHIAECVDRLAVGADQACFERGSQAVAELFAVAQAGEVEEILGLHEGGSENPVDGQDADAPQGRGGLVRHNSTLFL